MCLVFELLFMDFRYAKKAEKSLVYVLVIRKMCLSTYVACDEEGESSVEINIDNSHTVKMLEVS
jgi:hypothetical protein